jgi:uncharacterized membrane protein YvbJ
MKFSNIGEDISKEIVKNRYCTNCGKQLEPIWKICPYCGVKVWKDTSKEKLTPKEDIIAVKKKNEFKTLVSSEVPIVKEEKKSPKPTKIICPFCGYENNLNRTYCYQCGYKF